MALTDTNHEAYWGEYFATIDDAFIERCERYDAGDINAADAWLDMKSEIDFFEAKIKERKEWGDTHRHAISDEFEKYGKDGYNGYKATVQTRTTLSYKSIPQWSELDSARKEVEAKAKLALQMQQKGLEPIDGSTGELLPLPDVTVTHFLKTDKVK